MSKWCEQLFVMMLSSTHTWFRNINILNVFQRIVSHTIYVNIIYCQVNGTILKQTLFRFVYLRKLLLKLLELLPRFHVIYKVCVCDG